MAKKKDTPSREALIEEMIDAASDFHHFGWLLGGTGQFSSRVDDKTVAITASGTLKRELSPDDFVDVDFDGKKSTKSAPAPSQATDLHLAIYKNTDATRTIYHVHHLGAAICSDRDRRQGFTHFEGLATLQVFGVESDDNILTIPIIEDAGEFEDRAEFLEKVVETLKAGDEPTAPCINIKHHGLYVWGDSPEQARRNVEACAYLFDYSERRPMNPKRSASVSGFQP